MGKVLVLAETGTGKSSSLVGIPKYGIGGLNPEDTFLLSCVNKPLPMRNSSEVWKMVTNKPDGSLMDFRDITVDNIGKIITTGNRVITKDATVIAKSLEFLAQSPYKNLVIDDLNYLSQDYYMKNAKKGGWDTPKEIGYNMHLIFEQIDAISESGKNIIVMAHFDLIKDEVYNTTTFKYKSTGKMVDEYITPEGKFETVLYGRKRWDATKKFSVREFVTNDDGKFPAKSPVDMFEDLYIPMDLGLVVRNMNAYYGT